MLRFLIVPYPFESSLPKRLMSCLGVSLFVFLFLYIFKPFGLNTYPVSLFILTLGYGLVTFVIMLFVNLIMLYTFPHYFNETKWTTGKELLWLLIMIGLIGLGNAFYTHSADIANLSIRSIFVFELYTIAVGIFPVSISVLLNQVRLRTSYQKSSEEINASLNVIVAEINSVAQETQETNFVRSIQESETETNLPELNDEPPKEIPLTIVAENGRDKFSVLCSELLFIRSADNYVEVFYFRENQTRCELIRTTLKYCTDLFINQSDFLRCHKSYLVNLSMVIRVSGNAQGYKLHLKNTDELIPVSRSNNDLMKERLSGLSGRP